MSEPFDGLVESTDLADVPEQQYEPVTLEVVNLDDIIDEVNAASANVPDGRRAYAFLPAPGTPETMPDIDAGSYPSTCNCCLKLSKSQIKQELLGRTLDLDILRQTVAAVSQVINSMPQTCDLHESSRQINEKLRSIERKITTSDEIFEQKTLHGSTGNTFDLIAYVSCRWHLPEKELMRKLNRAVQVTRFKIGYLRDQENEVWDTEYDSGERKFFKSVNYDLETFYERLIEIQKVN